MLKKLQYRLLHFVTGSPSKMVISAKSWITLIETQRSIFVMFFCLRFPLSFLATSAFAAFSLPSVNATAQSSPITLAPGEYLGEDCVARPSLKPGKSGALKFAI